MNQKFEEWEGSKSKKFTGSIRITSSQSKTGLNLFGTSSKAELNRIEQVKSKKHFTVKQSETLTNWRPCLKIFKSQSQKHPFQKLTEVPCTTHLKPLRHTEKFQVKESLGISKTLWHKTLEKFKYQEEQLNVRNLEKWEKNVLNKKNVQEEYRFRTLGR